MAISFPSTASITLRLQTGSALSYAQADANFHNLQVSDENIINVVTSSAFVIEPNTFTQPNTFTEITASNGVNITGASKFYSPVTFNNGITVVGGINASLFVGNLLGTASWSETSSRAVTSSYTDTASYVALAEQAKSVIFSNTASFAQTASYIKVLGDNITVKSGDHTIELTASLAEFYAYSASTNNYTASINVWTSSIQTKSQFNTWTGSFYNVFTGSTVTKAYIDGITGSFADTSSFNSWTGSSTSTFEGTASYVATSSWADNATTASYVQTADTASYVATSSWADNATTASYALTASYVKNAETASYVNVVGDNITVNYNGSEIQLTGSSGTSLAEFYTYSASLNNWTSSVASTSSFDTFTGSYNTGSFQGDLTGTASWAENVTSASYATTASYVDTASYVATSSWADNATTASYALTASYVPTSSWTNNAVEAQNVTIVVKNLDTNPITKGTPLYITASGTSGNIAGVYPADASNPLRMPAAAVAGEVIAAGAEGIGLQNGFISGVDTSLFESGDEVFVGVGGGYTNVEPVYPNLIQKLGNVEKKHNSNGSGVIKMASEVRALPNLQQNYMWVGDVSDKPETILTSSIIVDNALTASHALTAPGYSSTASFNNWTGSTYNTFTGSYNTGSFQGTLDGTATTASYIDLVAGPGISIQRATNSLLSVTSSVRTVNGVSPTNGNISLSLTSTLTGDSASLAAAANPSPYSTGSIWIVSGDADPTKNGDTYILVSGSGGATHWEELSGFDTAAADARYLKLDGANAPMTGDVDFGTNKITNLGEGSLSTDAINLGQLTASINTLSAGVSASLNASSSTINNRIDLLTGSVDIINNWTGSSTSIFEGTASYVLGTSSFSDLANTASYVATSSWADNATTASYVATSSWAANYNETDTLQDVTSRGNSTTGSIDMGNGLDEAYFRVPTIANDPSIFPPMNTFPLGSIIFCTGTSPGFPEGLYIKKSSGWVQII